MKKVYTKPLAILEDISLSEHIAACDQDSSYANNLEITIGQLKEELKRVGYFTSADSCIFQVNEGVEIEYDGYTLCYHTAVDNGTLFSS